MVFLENFYEILLLAHLFATFVLIGSMTHNLLCVVNYLHGRFGRQKLEWLYVKVHHITTSQFAERKNY